jgi:ectoine hydroxylase-related dioxygenase (phytanoyl-CoA dioxygenase family)
MRLTAEQEQQYEADGFLRIERLIDDETVAALCEAYDEVVSEGRDGARMLGGITRQLMMASQLHPLFKSNPALDAARELVTPLLHDPTYLFDMLIYKPPGHPHETPWHQDMSYTGYPVAEPGISIPLFSIQFWVALDDADEENGCMHFVPGIHTKPLLPHVVASGSPDSDARLLALADAERDLPLDQAVPCPLKAGGATMHSYGTPHYTPPNRSASRPRRAYIFNFISDRGLAKVLAERQN